MSESLAARLEWKSFFCSKAEQKDWERKAELAAQKKS